MTEYISVPIKKKQLRAKCHYVFDKIWKEGLMSRNEAYDWLAKKMFLSHSQCHFTRMDRTALLMALEISMNFLNENYRNHDLPIFKTI